jgi:hypothetical protein
MDHGYSLLNTKNYKIKDIIRHWSSSEHFTCLQIKNDTSNISKYLVKYKKKFKHKYNEIEFNDIVEEIAPIFRDIYNVLFNGYAIDSVETIHELSELNKVTIPKEY